MSKRAKEEAWKVYPKGPEQKYITAFGTFEFDYDAPHREGFITGYEQAEKDLGWHSVDESLPPIDEEVIVLTDELNTAPIYKIAFGHTINKEEIVYVDGKPYKPESHSGWNIPAVKYWMPMPKLGVDDEMTNKILKYREDLQ